MTTTTTAVKIEIDTTEVAKLEKRINDAQAALSDAEGRYKRLLADLDKFGKAMAKLIAEEPV